MAQDMPINRILVGIDFSDGARDAFYAAIGLATRYDADVYVLHAAEPIRSFDVSKRHYVEAAETIERVEEGVKRRIDELWTEGGLDAVDRRRIHTVVEGGRAAQLMIRVARDKEIDLIVLGASGSGGAFGAIMGSTAERIVRDAPCSVYTVRQHRAPTAS